MIIICKNKSCRKELCSEKHLLPLRENGGSGKQSKVAVCEWNKASVEACNSKCFPFFRAQSFSLAHTKDTF